MSILTEGTTPGSGVQRFRKKPVVIEAMCFESASAGSIIALWCGGNNEASPECIDIPTLEGTMRAQLGDYVIRGVKGEFYPCKADVFQQTYELVEVGK